jgi:hypothetical protein
MQINTPRSGTLTVLSLVALLWSVPAHAHHVVFLDFSEFGLSAYPTVNGHTPPTAADLTAIRELIIAKMVKDYAAFDVQFTTVTPASGSFTRLTFFDDNANGLFGCAGPSCCLFGNCTGIGTFTQAQSGVEVYAGSFAADSNFSGANATTARIANAIAGTGSHELGHVLGLRHCHAADDFVASGAACSDGFQGTNDANVNFHLMASGASSGLTMAQRATRDRFFSVHSERRVLFSNFQTRNHWNPLGNINAGVGRSDLTFGRIGQPDIVEWFNRLSLGSSFSDDLRTFASDAGQRADTFMLGDVDGDNRVDLVIGEVLTTNTVRWRVRLATSTAFAAATVFATDAGNAGDIFRLADIDGDGDKDLLRGTASSAATVAWAVHLSSGSGFGAAVTLANDAGNRGDLFLVGDVTGDSRDDLVAVRRGSGGVEVHASFGNLLGNMDTEDDLNTLSPDYVFLGDVNGDGKADLVTGLVISNTRVDWDVQSSVALVGDCSLGGGGPRVCFAEAQRFRTNGGDAGDQFRLADGDGDGRMDLFLARPNGMTSLTAAPNTRRVSWLAHPSTGTTFAPEVTFLTNGNREGDLFP